MDGTLPASEPRRPFTKLRRLSGNELLLLLRMPSWWRRYRTCAACVGTRRARRPYSGSRTTYGIRLRSATKAAGMVPQARAAEAHPGRPARGSCEGGTAQAVSDDAAAD